MSEKITGCYHFRKLTLTGSAYFIFINFFAVTGAKHDNIVVLYVKAKITR